MDLGTYEGGSEDSEGDSGGGEDGGGDGDGGVEVEEKAQ